MSFEETGHRPLAELLGDLENVAKIPAKQRAIKISSLVDRICSKAYEDGLANMPLNRLVDLITNSHELGQAAIGNLIKNLYPASEVPDEIAVKVVGGLGHGRGKPSYPVQAALLRWLVMVYDVLEHQHILSQLYSILFNLLDTTAIRPQLCHVLSLITRRKHVRPFRIQALMELMRQVGNEPPLVGLMRVYKDYYPDVIVGDMTSGRASVFKHPNQEWRQRLDEIREASFQKTQGPPRSEKPAFIVSRNKAYGLRRTKSSIIPEVHTSHAHESSVTLEEIDGVRNFVENLEKIELPNQLIAVIGDPLLQRFLQLRSSESSSKRVNSWLLAYLEDQLEVSESAESQILVLMEVLLDYTHYTKTLPPACLTYLQCMLDSWDGITGREVVLDLLAFTPIGPFEELYASIFQPLEDAILDGAIDSKVTLLTFYRNLLDQWVVSLLSQPFPGIISTLTSLINHIDNLALTIVQTSLTVTTLSAILDFYESTSFLFSIPSLRSTARIVIPPSELIYTLQFTYSISTLSRLCTVLTLYKRAFESSMSPKLGDSLIMDQQSYPKDYVNHFNGFLMDVCNCLWRSRAFNTSDPNALGCLIVPTVISSLGSYVSKLETSLSLPSLFSFSYSPVFCLLAISYIRELEDGAEDDIDLRHAGPVTQNTLKQLEKDGGLKLTWADYRLGVLQYMENKGVPGVGELMYNTMKHLMNARESKA